MAGWTISARYIFAGMACTAAMCTAAFAAPDEKDRQIQQMFSRDPVAVYVEAGINKEQEGKIRQLAKDFEDMQGVRLKLMATLLKDMRALQLEADPDEKKVLAKQEDINKVHSEMATDRVKLMLKIRGIMTPEQKQRLVQLIQERDKNPKMPPTE